MAPTTRSVKTSSKENVFNNPIDKPTSKIKTIKRKPLGDKTNSGSDENETGETIVKQTHPKAIDIVASKKKTNQTNSSFKIIKCRDESNRTEEKLGVYEFTYDPNDEPPPKKKRKRVVKKKPAPKPKTYFFTQNYDKKLSRALENLKEKMKKAATTVDKIPSVNIEANRQQCEIQAIKTQGNMEKNVPEKKTTPEIAIKPAPNYDKNKEIECDINYSPVQSPNPVLDTPQTLVVNDANDDLNLQDEISFFDDIPVASSSLNSSKHSLASPWRVDIDLPHKTPINMCVKPDMTPAFESSFIDDQTQSNKKHVYTNILSEPCEIMPQRTEKTTANDNLNWKQSSIMSFIKEVTIKNLKKKKFLTPVKNNSIFDDSIVDVETITKQSFKTPSKEKTPDRNKTLQSSQNFQNNHKEMTPERIMTSRSLNFKDLTQTETVEKTPVQRNNNNIEPILKETPQQNDIENCFGFDDTSENNQENIPLKRFVNRKRNQALKPRSRAVLKELNRMGPSRAKFLRAAKTKGRDTEEINEIFEQMQSKETAILEIVEGEKSDRNNPDASAVAQEVRNDINDEDSRSIHLFEDIDIVHHLKPNRKSYGKAKNVTFHQSSNLDTGTQGLDDSLHSDDEYIEDKTFKIPAIKKSTKKTVHKKKVQKRSKKEEEEFEAWAADFNSMCENVEHCPLVVE